MITVTRKTATLQYKCRRCGEVFQSNETLPEMASGVQYFMNRGLYERYDALIFPPVLLHNCADYKGMSLRDIQQDIGLADCIGGSFEVHESQQLPDPYVNEQPASEREFRLRIEGGSSEEVERLLKQVLPSVVRYEP